MLKKWILHTISVVIAGAVSSSLGWGFVVTASVNDPKSIIVLMIGVGLLALLNATLGLVVKLLTLPITCLTLGLFTIFVNAWVLMIAGKFQLGFTVKDFWSALFASVLISVAYGILAGLFGVNREDREVDG